MDNSRVYAIPFATVYPLYIQKAEKKGRTKEEVDIVISWLTGYDNHGISEQVNKKVDLRTFFNEAPQMNPDAVKITGVVCGVRVEAMEDKLMQNIRYMDKLIDELAKGKPVNKILRS